METVHGIFEIPNSKHQIPNKSQIPNTNDINYFKFSNVDKLSLLIHLPHFNEKPDGFSELACTFFKIASWLLFGILHIVIYLSFGICYLEFHQRNHPVNGNGL